MCKWGTDQEVTITRRLTVDACLADTIVALNTAGVVTTGCCCGHGHPEARPWANIMPSSQDRARELGYEVGEAPSGDPLVWLTHAPAAPADLFTDLRVTVTRRGGLYRATVASLWSSRTAASAGPTPWVAILRALKEMDDTPHPRPTAPTPEVPHGE